MNLGPPTKPVSRPFTHSHRASNPLRQNPPHPGNPVPPRWHRGCAPTQTSTASQLTHLIQRICSCLHGLKEADNCRILRDNVEQPHHLPCTLPYLKTRRRCQYRCAIRKSCKTALALPTLPSTDRLLNLGLHNTLSEKTEVHLQNQLQCYNVPPSVVTC